MLSHVFGSARPFLDCNGQSRPSRLPILLSQIGPDNSLRNEIEVVHEIQRNVDQKFFRNTLVQLSSAMYVVQISRSPRRNA